MTDNTLPFINDIAKRINKAIEDKDVELEVIVDQKIVDRSTFIKVKEYLNSNAFYKTLNNGIPEISLDIHTKFVKKLPNDKEFITSSFERGTIVGQLNVQKYCKTNKINRINKENLLFIKKNSVVENNLLKRRKEYFKSWPSKEQRKSGQAPYFQYRVNVKNEIELDSEKGSDGKSQQDRFIKRIYNYDKSFRYKCRWSFVSGIQQHLFRIDCTAVKSSKFNEYYPTFKESNTLGQPEIYEIEIEYIGNKQDQYVFPELDEDSISPDSPDYSPPKLKKIPSVPSSPDFLPPDMIQEQDSSEYTSGQRLVSDIPTLESEEKLETQLWYENIQEVQRLFKEADDFETNGKKEFDERVKDLDKDNYEYIEIEQEYKNTILSRANVLREEAIELSKKTFNEPLDIPPVDLELSITYVYKILNKILENILKVVYNTTYLITEQKREEIHDGYKIITDQESSLHPKFVGPQPVSMSMENIISGEQPNIKDNEYLVSEKADGERYLLYIHTDSYGYLYNNKHKMNEIINTGIHFSEEYYGWILDGEYITKLEDSQATRRFYIFDIYYHREGTEIIKTFQRQWIDTKKDDNILKGRLKYIDQFTDYIDSKEDLSEKSIQIFKKKYQYVSGNTFEAARIKLSQIESKYKTDISLLPYKTDGLVFLPVRFPVNGMSLSDNISTIGGTWYANFKWKPVELNTIDFAVKINPEIFQMIDPDDNTNIINYKKVSLLVFHDSNMDDDIDFVKKTIEYPQGEKITRKTIVFNPEKTENPIGETNIILENNKMLCFEDKDEVKGNTIVEFSYDITKPIGFNWVPLRLRRDKLKPQPKNIANNIWNTIKNPITNETISRGLELDEEEKVIVDIKKSNKYYNANINRDASVIKSQADFHNFIKRRLIVGVSNLVKQNQEKKQREEMLIYASFGVSMIDLTIGRGGDLSKFLDPDAHINKILGFDLSDGNIEECCRRWWNMSQKQKGDKMALFISGNSSFNIRSGEIANNDLLKMNLLSKIFTAQIFEKIQNYDINLFFNMFATQRDPSLDRQKYEHKIIERKDEINESVKTMLDTQGITPEDSNYKQKKKDYLKIRVNMLTAYPAFDVCNIQFSIHYFFENPKTLEGLLQNIDDNLVDGGYFIGTCFDGHRVLEFLRDTDEGKDKEYNVNDYKAIAIRKEYSISEEDFTWNPDADSEELTRKEPYMLGKQISVFQETFGDFYPEWLVNFDYFIWKCSQYNLYPIESERVEKDEYNRILTASMGYFSDIYSEYIESEGEEKQIDEELQGFSFLNRWFIFKKIEPED